MWKQANTLQKKGDDERFLVYLAFDDRTVQLAEWVAYTNYGSEYHSNGTYLGEFPQGGDALYMTYEGFDVRMAEDGEWETFRHHDDGSKTRVVVVGWMEALRPEPDWDRAEVFPLDKDGIPIMF